MDSIERARKSIQKAKERQAAIIEENQKLKNNLEQLHAQLREKSIPLAVICAPESEQPSATPDLLKTVSQKQSQPQARRLELESQSTSELSPKDKKRIHQQLVQKRYRARITTKFEKLEAENIQMKKDIASIQAALSQQTSTTH